MTTPLYRIPNELVCDGDIVGNAEYFSPEVRDRVRTFPMREEDVLIVGYPKSGTTWMQELAYLVFHNADTDKAKATPLVLRSKFLELCIPGVGAGVDLIPHDPHPWIMKSHLPVRYFTKQLEERKVKVIVVMRNPKDTLVSFYFFNFYKDNSVLGNFPGTWNDFFELVKVKHLQYADVFDWNVGWWSEKNNNNILFVKYEDLKKDIRGVIRQVARHCSREIGEAGVEKIATHVSFKAMRDNPLVDIGHTPGCPFTIDNFYRKGQIGDWRNYFSEKQSRYVDERYERSYLPVGLNFDFQ